MDPWIAIAAAGASYVARHWQNFLRDRESSSEFHSGHSKVVKPESPPFMGHLCDKSCPFGRLAQRKRRGEDVITEREQAARSGSTPEVASTSGFDGEKLADLDNYRDCSLLSISSLSPGYLRNENLQEVVEEWKDNDNMSENFSNSFAKSSMTEMGNSYGLTRNRSSLRSRQSNPQFIKPLTSLESCLMAQLYKEYAGLEEYVLNSVSSTSSPAVRPFFVTDGRRIISRGVDDSFNLQIETGKNKLHEQIRSAENETVFGVPPLPYVRSLELPRMKVKTGKEVGRKLSSSSKMANGKHFHSLSGSSHGVLLFSLGVSVGLISTFLANKREVDKLNDLLRQTENLVQDLQDELEMKDSLTVKELAIEDYESQDTCYCSCNQRAPHLFASEQNFDGSTNYDGKELPDQKAEEDSESMSKIEAELEAELERLELNMNSSSLEGRLSDLVELDPDFMPGITQSELKPDMFGKEAVAQPYADQDGSGTSTHHSANYAVSPQELSLRLHKVIQSRLEERVKELEIALKNSKRKVQVLESEHKIFRRDFSDGKLRSSPYQGSPIPIEQQNAIDQPVVINLSGEALDAYNEVYNEFVKMNESEEADITSGDKKNHQKAARLFHQNVCQRQNGEVNHYQPPYTITNGRRSPTLIPHEVRTLDGHISSGDESDHSGQDEMEKILIKQILEKTRKDSSVILSAEKRLFSVDEFEH